MVGLLLCHVHGGGLGATLPFLLAGSLGGRMLHCRIKNKAAKNIGEF